MTDEKKYAKRCEAALHQMICRTDDMFDKLWLLAVTKRRNASASINTRRCTHYLVIQTGINEIRRLHRSINLMHATGQFPNSSDGESKDYLRLIRRIRKLHKELMHELINLKG